MRAQKLYTCAQLYIIIIYITYMEYGKIYIVFIFVYVRVKLKDATNVKTLTPIGVCACFLCCVNVCFVYN